MTREEREQALEWFKNRPITMSGAKKMYDLAISALEQPEPCEDTISRQAAIDKLNERQRKLIYCFGLENDAVKIMDIAKSIVITMPSAQPEHKTEGGEE